MQCVANVINEYRGQNGNSEYVFTNPATGKPYVDIKRAFTTACKKAGIKDLRIHDLRHYFGSSFVKRGVDLVIVKELMGHSSVTTTQSYAHTLAKEKSQAVEVLSQSYSHWRQKSVKYQQNNHLPEPGIGLFTVN